MRRTFNTTGPCDEARHYMLPAEAHLPDLVPWVERQLYFVLHAARQTGKTTAMRAFAARLRERGYVALPLPAAWTYTGFDPAVWSALGVQGKYTVFQLHPCVNVVDLDVAAITATRVLDPDVSLDASGGYIVARFASDIEVNGQLVSGLVYVTGVRDCPNLSDLLV